MTFTLVCAAFLALAVAYLVPQWWDPDFAVWAKEEEL